VVSKIIYKQQFVTISIAAVQKHSTNSHK